MNENKEKQIENYILFVDEMINKFKALGDVVSKDNDCITPEKLNTALAHYYRISMALNAEYQRCKIEYLFTKQEFDNWENEIFDKAKKSVLEELETTKIKPSVKEYEARARNLFRNEYDEKLAELNLKESKMQFILRMMNTVNSYDDILITMSSNMRNELKSLSLEDRMNSAKDNFSQKEFPKGLNNE